MKASRRIRRILSAVSRTEQLDKRCLIWEEAARLGTGIRAIVGAKGNWRESPVIVWIGPGQSREAVTESLGWALGLIALGHFSRLDDRPLVVATLSSDSSPDPDLSGCRLRSMATHDISLKALIWTAYLLVDGQRYAETIRNGATAGEARRTVARGSGIPEDLVNLWERCQEIGESEFAPLIGYPRMWESCVIAHFTRERALVGDSRVLAWTRDVDDENQDYEKPDEED